MGRRSRERHPAAASPPAEGATAAGAVDDRKRNALIVIALAVAILFVYAQVRHHDFLNYGDDEYVTANRHVASGDAAWAFRTTEPQWHPLTWLTHMLDVRLFGLAAGRHLLVNVALHAVNALLVFFLLQRLTGFTGRSALVAALFALHPLRVESVAWVAERKDVLAAMLMLLALHAYASYARSRAKLHYALALIAFALGLMAKSTLVALPLVLLLVDYWPLRRTAPLIEKLPFFALSLVSLVLTTFASSQSIGNALTSYGVYLFRTIWPMRLATPYAPRDVEPLPLAFALLLVAGLTAWAVASRREKPALFTGWLWFVLVLVPLAWQSTADRHTYLPHIGLFIAVVWLAAESLPDELRKPAGIAALVIAAIFGGVTSSQIEHWRSSRALFAHTLSVTGPNRIAHRQLARALQEEGNQAAALAQLEAAVNAEPAHTETLIELARLEIVSGREKQAVARLEKAAAADRKPATRALLAAARGDKNALELYAAAVRSEPDSAALHNDYGTALGRAGRDADAVREYREALRLDPTLYDARMNAAAVLSRLERNDEARAELVAASRLRPFSAEPHVYLALVNANANRIGDAVANVERALALNEAEANVRFTNAVRLPYKETNLREYLIFLRQQQR